jgi:molecular chaperone DnaJ
MSKDYYQILGVDKKATKDDIKKAFRTMAHKHHPDKKGGDAAKFKEASEAYSVLTDDKKRAEYDAYGRVFSGGNGGGPQGAGGFGQDFGGFDFSQFTNAEGGFGGFDFGEVFSDFFGGGAGTQAVRGRDISIDLELSFSESIFGVERKVLLTKTSACDTCKGSGGKPGTEMKSCETCNGKGKIRETRRSFLGSFSTTRTCDNCHGSGKVPKDKCPECRGAGVLRKEEEIAIAVPAGVEEGEMVRLGGKGEAALGGAAGDLYVKLHIKRDPRWKKEGNNLATDLTVKLTDALLGAEYSLQTLDGDLKIKIPAGVTFGEILRVKGKGVPIDRSRRGDLMIRIIIQLPTKLSRDAQKTLEQLRKEGI